MVKSKFIEEIIALTGDSTSLLNLIETLNTINSSDFVPVSIDDSGDETCDDLYIKGFVIYDDGGFPRLTKKGEKLLQALS